jgi:hypothetical protein
VRKCDPIFTRLGLLTMGYLRETLRCWASRIRRLNATFVCGVDLENPPLLYDSKYPSINAHATASCTTTRGFSPISLPGASREGCCPCFGINWAAQLIPFGHCTGLYLEQALSSTITLLGIRPLVLRVASAPGGVSFIISGSGAPELS